MLSLVCRRSLLRKGRNAVKVIKNDCSNGGGISDAKAARAARKSRINEVVATPVEAKAMIGPRTAVGGVVLVMGGLCVYSIKTDRKGILGSLYWGSPVESTLTEVYNYFRGWMESISVPYEDKLLPDWPSDPIYGNPPPGYPCPPLLVLDLEKTLIRSEHSPQYGWRHVKRPGLDQLIDRLRPYYEIVVFSENDVGVVTDILMAIDPTNGKVHKLGSAAAEARDGVMIKRLDLMNRDIRQIILIDDNPAAAQMFPRNTLIVKPYTKNDDDTDRILFDLVPLLQAFVHDGAVDFRDTIDDLGTHEAEETCIEYKMRVSEKKKQLREKRNRGLGGMVRANSGTADLDPEEFRSKVLSASQIIGVAPTQMVSESASISYSQKSTVVQHKGYGGKDVVVGGSGPKIPAEKKKGALFAWLDESEKEREENQMRKSEKMNEIYGKRMSEKAQKDEREKSMA